MTVLLITSASIAFIHTITGPDHYLPFVMIGKARGWSLTRTAGITFLCGVGHVLGSVVLGLMGAQAGVSLLKIDQLRISVPDFAPVRNRQTEFHQSAGWNIVLKTEIAVDLLDVEITRVE